MSSEVPSNIVWETIMKHTELLDADFKTLREFYPSQISLLKTRLGELEKKVSDLKFFCHFYKEIIDVSKD